MVRSALFLIAFSCLAASEGLLILDDIYHTDYLEAGGEIEGCIALMNTSDEPIQVKVYAKDFTFNLKEEVSFLEPGVLKRSNAKWVETKYTRLEIPPFTACPFHYTIRVPKDPSLQGSYWSVLMFESCEDSQVLSSPDGTELKALKRYAFQFVTQVGNRGLANLRVMDKRVELINDRKRFALDLENTGTLSLRITPSAEVVNAKGEQVGLFVGEKKLLHPSCSSKFDIDITSVPKGNYKIRLLLKHEEKNLFSTEYALEIPDPLP